MTKNITTISNAVLWVINNQTITTCCLFSEPKAVRHRRSKGKIPATESMQSGFEDRRDPQETDAD